MNEFPEHLHTLVLPKALYMLHILLFRPQITVSLSGTPIFKDKGNQPKHRTFPSKVSPKQKGLHRLSLLPLSLPLGLLGLMDLQGQLRHLFFHVASPAPGGPGAPPAPSRACLPSHSFSNRRGGPGQVTSLPFTSVSACK